jgi:hypothetical protein
MGIISTVGFVKMENLPAGWDIGILTLRTGLYGKKLRTQKKAKHNMVKA